MNENSLMRAEIRQLQDRICAIQRSRSGQEVDEMREIQARADSVLAILGERVSGPRLDETAPQYRARIAEKVAQFSPRFKGESLRHLGPAALEAAEREIYADAQRTGHDTANSRQGVLIEETFVDDAGRRCTKYHGDMMAWMAPFTMQGITGSFNRPK